MRRGSSYCALLPFRNLALQKDKPDISGNQQIRLTSRLQYMTAWHLPVYMTTESVHCFTNKKERTYRISLESMPQSVGLCRFLRTAYTTIGVAKLLSMTFEHSDGPSDLRSNSKIELRDLLFISTFHNSFESTCPNIYVGKRIVPFSCHREIFRKIGSLGTRAVWTNLGRKDESTFD